LRISETSQGFCKYLETSLDFEGVHPMFCLFNKEKMQERYIFDLRSETPTEIQAVVLQAENLELVGAWYED